MRCRTRSLVPVAATSEVGWRSHRGCGPSVSHQLVVISQKGVGQVTDHLDHLSVGFGIPPFQQLGHRLTASGRQLLDDVAPGGGDHQLVVPGDIDVFDRSRRNQRDHGVTEELGVDLQLCGHLFDGAARSVGQPVEQPDGPRLEVDAGPGGERPVELPAVLTAGRPVEQPAYLLQRRTGLGHTQVPRRIRGADGLAQFDLRQRPAQQEGDEGDGNPDEEHG